MSADDESTNPQLGDFADPLTSPIWQPSEEDMPLLAPTFAEFNIPNVTTAPPGPIEVTDVDELLSGQYTGWIPIITPGMRPDGSIDSASFESPEELLVAIEAQIVAEEEKDESNFSEVLTSRPNDLVEDSAVAVEPRIDDDFTIEVADPDAVISPAQALEEARARIEQMRASLQLNLSRVAQSFEHPIFNAEQTGEVFDDSNAHAEPSIEHIDEVIEDDIDEVEAQEPDVQMSTVVVQEQNDSTHALELAIMRDEIQDLRERLTNSQRLVEELMHKLANLTEIALKR